ncbi:MAG TPA: hypothetical protein VNV43_05865, partial [Candidatus Acidoferrales bacterium]|nr:hypothetical protein [Candidatus Acidoferrales bacterium]
MPWNEIPDDAAIIGKIKDCGFTIAGFVSPEALETCHKVGIKGIVYDPRIYQNDWTKLDAATAREKALPAIVAVRKNPALYGYFLCDEPGAGAFPGLAIMTGLVREAAPRTPAYVNLFPNYAGPGQLGTDTYEKYVDDFATTVRPAQLCYDHYALMDDGTLRDSYWANLAEMRTAAQKYNVPFWNIILSVAHFHYRIPTADDFRFEVYSSLASGARGIVYYSYFAYPVGNYRGAAIDQFGHATPTWDNIQNVNLQIQNLAPTLLNLTSDAVYHFGKMPQGCQGPDTNSLVAAMDGDFGVGDFTHVNGTRYVMIVNEDLRRSASCSPQFRHAPKRVKLISPYSGQAEPMEGEQTWLAPGGGVLLELSNDK